MDVWEEFVRRFHRLIASVVLRTATRFGDSSRQTVDDLIQETYLKLCAGQYRVLRNFEEQHPDAFLGYIKVLAANVVRDHFKASYSQKRGANQVDEIKDEFVAAAGEDSTGSPKSIERAVLIQEVKHHLAFCLHRAGSETQPKHFLASLPGRSFRACDRRATGNGSHHQGCGKHHHAYHQGVARANEWPKGRSSTGNPGPV